MLAAPAPSRTKQEPMTPQQARPQSEESLTHAARDRRIRRAMEPSANGQFRVCEEVRKLWANKATRDEVFEMFAQCGDNTDRVTLGVGAQIAVTACMYLLLQTAVKSM